MLKIKQIRGWNVQKSSLGNFQELYMLTIYLETV